MKGLSGPVEDNLLGPAEDNLLGPTDDNLLGTTEDNLLGLPRITFWPAEDNHSAEPSFPLQRTQLTISHFRDLTPSDFTTINIRKALIIRGVRCSEKKSGRSEMGVQEQ